MKIYLADISELNNELYERALQLVSAYRLNKVNSLRNESDKQRSLTAGLLLNYATGVFVNDIEDRHYSSASNDNMDVIDGADRNFRSAEKTIEKVSAATLIKSYNKLYDYEVKTKINGKPYFSSEEGIHFSISHSGRFVACAVSDKEIGIDIEGARKADVKIAKRYFSRDEMSWLTDCDGSLQDKRFFMLWSLKEAFSKATGEGIAKGIGRVGFDVEKHSCYVEGVLLEKIRFYSWEIKGYYLSIVELL